MVNSNLRKTQTQLSSIEYKQSSSKIDPAKAIKEAIEATKMYGATSYKARMAWEVVENIDTNERNKSNVGRSLLDYTDIDVDATRVENTLLELKEQFDEEMAKVNHLKHMANEIKVSTTLYITKLHPSNFIDFTNTTYLCDIIRCMYNVIYIYVPKRQ